MRILVAEDNAINALLLRFQLERMGCPADVAANGREAVEALRARSYDAILMDVQMPGIDGIQATKLIREEFPEESQPAIIALTANVSEADRLRCMEAGMDGYLTKPVRRQLLAETLRQAGRFRSRRGA